MKGKLAKLLIWLLVGLAWAFLCLAAADQGRGETIT